MSYFDVVSIISSHSITRWFVLPSSILITSVKSLWIVTLGKCFTWILHTGVSFPSHGMYAIRYLRTLFLYLFCHPIHLWVLLIHFRLWQCIQNVQVMYLTLQENVKKGISSVFNYLFSKSNKTTLYRIKLQRLVFTL